VTVQWPGDCNGDGHVNDDDMTIIQDAMFTQFPDPNYDPRADLNGDGRIRGDDMIIWGMWTHRGPLDYCDVDVTSMTFSYGTALVYPTWENPLQIYVTVKNKGTNTENVQVTFYCNATAIDTKELNLTAGDEGTLTFAWNIPNATYPYLNYTLNATATLPCDENLSNNGRNGSVTVQWPGDCNGDGHINATDLLSPYFRDDLDIYNTRSDFNGDCLVDTEDVKILIDNWETGPLD